MLQREEALDILAQAGVMQKGHFLLTSGRHADRYLQCARLFENTQYSEMMCASLAEHFAQDEIDVVIGPAMGAVQMAYEVSRHLHCPNFFTEREDGAMTLRRGFSLSKGQRVLVVDDILTTGGSIQEVIALVRTLDAVIAGVGVIVDRSGGKVDFGCKLASVITMEVESWEAADCPLCKQGLPFVKPGSRRK